MKRIPILVIFLIFLWFSSIFSVWAKQGEEDPFRPKLPQIGVISSAKREAKRQKESVEPLPEMNIQGVIWGTDIPQAIIDGDVYRIGDRVKGSGAKIIGIGKDGVDIIYFGNIYKLKVEKFFEDNTEKRRKE